MSRPCSFDGKTDVVTGGTSGIGARTVWRFAEAGASVVALEAADPHAPVHPGICCVEFHVTDSEALTRRIRALPRVDALANDVGISRHADEYRMDQFEHVLNVNLTSVMRASDAALPALSVNGGSIVNLASCSPGASFVTGAIVPVDGGYSTV